MHPLGALVTGGVAGAIFVLLFTLTQNRWRIDDVLGVWPLHGLCGAWGGIAAGIFGQAALGGRGGVSVGAQLLGTLARHRLGVREPASSSTACCAQRWGCASRRKTSSPAPTSRSTRSARRPTAKSAGRRPKRAAASAATCAARASPQAR